MSNRSLAAARQRRSPQEVVSSSAMKKDALPQYAPPPSAKGRPSTAPGPSKESNPNSEGALSNKLSIGDAIGLITIRLSKLESHLLKDKQEGQAVMNSNASSVSDVDTILRNVVSRINVLEKSQEGVDQQLEELTQSVTQLESSTPVNELLTPVVVAGPASPDPLLLERLDKTERELSELKQLVIKMQSMLIDVTMAQKFASASPPVNKSSSIKTPTGRTLPATSTVPPALEEDEEEDAPANGHDDDETSGTMTLEI